MKKLILILAVTAFALSPMVSEAGGRGAEQLLPHSSKNTAPKSSKSSKVTKAPRHASKHHKKHHKKHHHKKHHKKNKKN